MYRATLLVALGVTLHLSSVGAAALVVNPARPITHQVAIQTIQTALSNGTSPAPTFGDATREAAIKATIDTVWAQAGIDVNFLPNVVRYNDTFAYQGLGVGVRPITDLNLMIGNASAQGGILNPSPSVINMFFVNVVPGFDAKASNWANGVGNIGLNGIAVFIGTSVSAEHAGHWLAHEIGHNLGLLHAPSGTTNLMTSSRNTELLSDSQISAVFSTQALEDGIALIPVGGTGFPRPLSSQTPGDYDRSGLVDASDYALWRNTLNSIFKPDGRWQQKRHRRQRRLRSVEKQLRSRLCRSASTCRRLQFERRSGRRRLRRLAQALGSTTDLSADGNGNGIVDTADYSTWKSNFGRGSAAAFEAGGEPQFAGQPGSPEPGSLVLCIIAFAAFFLSRRR